MPFHHGVEALLQLLAAALILNLQVKIMSLDFTFELKESSVLCRLDM